VKGKLVINTLHLCSQILFASFFFSSFFCRALLDSLASNTIEINQSHTLKQANKCQDTDGHLCQLELIVSTLNIYWKNLKYVFLIFTNSCDKKRTPNYTITSTKLNTSFLQSI
jgi:hypothetical protein